MPTVHLITILYRSEADLPAFLDSLQAQDWRDWRLYVLDNASPDRSADLVSERKDARIIMHRNATNLGFAKAANQGIRAAAADGGEFFILINNDTAFSPDFLRRLIMVRSELGAGVIAPRIMHKDKPGVAWYAGGSFTDWPIFMNVHHQEHNPNAQPSDTHVDFASGCCLGISREVLQKVGLLDESFFVYWEDTDFCMRLKALDIPIVYTSEPSLLHSGGSASGGEWSPSYIRLFYRSYMLFLRKHFGWRRAVGTGLRLLLLRTEQSPRNYPEMQILASSVLRGLTARLAAQSYLDWPLNDVDRGI